MDELYHDYLVYIREHELEKYSVVKKVVFLLFGSTFIIVFLYRVSNHENRIVRFLSIPFYKIVRIVSGVQIPRGAVIGKGLFLPHYGNIILNKSAKYGEFLTLYHGVTIGAKGAASNDRFTPDIGNNVRISAGATVLGGIKVGDNATIGAGAVVVKDVQSGSISAGNPARSI